MSNKKDGSLGIETFSDAAKRAYEEGSSVLSEPEKQAEWRAKEAERLGKNKNTQNQR